MDKVQEFARERDRMVADQIEARGVYDPRVLDAMRRVPRHLFVPPAYRGRAYDDRPLPAGNGQTISQPFMVAFMSMLLDLRPDDRVLEIGTGSGYQAAILSLLAGWVDTIEFIPELAGRARKRLETLGFHHITIHSGDGTLGLPASAPFQGIIVTAAAPQPPPPLLSQLDMDGRLVLPIGGPGEQILQVWRRTPHGFDVQDTGPVAFVPLRGAFGWREEEWVSR